MNANGTLGYILLLNMVAAKRDFTPLLWDNFSLMMHLHKKFTHLQKTLIFMHLQRKTD